MRFEQTIIFCAHCHHGHNPRDQQLDVEATEFSTGVRRMVAVMDSETSFEQSREQLELLAVPAVTAKAVECQAEAIGGNIEAGEQSEILCAKQADLPDVCAPAVPLLYIEMDGDVTIWFWNLAEQHFPGAIQIVDLFHARQHLWDLSGKLFAATKKPTTAGLLAASTAGEMPRPL